MNEVYLGETWIVDGLVADAYGRSIPLLAGSTIRVRMHDDDELLLDLSTPIDGTIVDADNGAYQFEITPAMQTAAGIQAKRYRMEVKAFLADGRESVQNNEIVLVKPSAFRTFPD